METVTVVAAREFQWSDLGLVFLAMALIATAVTFLAMRLRSQRPRAAAAHRS